MTNPRVSMLRKDISNLRKHAADGTAWCDEHASTTSAALIESTRKVCALEIEAAEALERVVKATEEVIGALLAGWPVVVGIEQDPDYVEIAKARVTHWMSSQ